MVRVRRSVIWTVPLDEFKTIVAKSKTFSDVLSNFGLENIGGNCQTLKRRMNEQQVDYSHILLNNRERKYISTRAPLSEIMKEKSTYSRYWLKQRLIKDGILKNQCSICNVLPVWLDKPLVLILDHINGIRDDHRKENLRFVCPNCASQLPTFAGRTRKNHKKVHKCKICFTDISPESKSSYCFSCFSKSRRKVERPTEEQLAKDLACMSKKSAGWKYGVSSNTILKWTRQNIKNHKNGPSLQQEYIPLEQSMPLDNPLLGDLV